MISKLINFIKTDIWRIRLKTLPRKKSFFVKQLRVILLAIRGFDEDKCQLRASALTFFSLLSIVPVAAMAFGVAKGFGFEKHLETQLFEKFSGQAEIMEQIVNFANSLLENTRGGMVAGIGIALLLWAVIKVLGNIEKSFNDIWGIKTPRSMGRKFSDYLSVMFLCPILIIISGSITVFIAAQITFITERFAFLGVFSGLILFLLEFLPYAMLWGLFTFIYMFMPNTKVNFKSALLAGIIAGTLYQVLQWGYFTFQIGMAKYNAIYGSFAALPLFLMWLQLSWLIVLFGGEISFAHQNVDTYELEPDCLKISCSFKKLLSLQITHLLVMNFSEGSKPLTSSEISHVLEMPIRLVREILYELVESRVVSEAGTQKNKELTYQPARDINRLTVKYVIDALEQKGVESLPVAQTRELKRLAESLEAFKAAVEKLPANKLLKDI